MRRPLDGLVRCQDLTMMLRLTKAAIFALIAVSAGGARAEMAPSETCRPVQAQALIGDHDVRGRAGDNQRGFDIHGGTLGVAPAAVHRLSSDMTPKARRA